MGWQRLSARLGTEGARQPPDLHVGGGVPEQTHCQPMGDAFSTSALCLVPAPCTARAEGSSPGKSAEG